MASDFCCSGCADPLKEYEAPDGVDEVGHADLHLGAADADSSDEEAHSGFLIGEHMLDTGADHGLASIGAPDQTEAAIDGDVVLVAECRNGEVDGRHRAILLRLCLGELDRPACVAVLVPQLRGLALPGLRYLSGLDVGFLRLRIALTQRGNKSFGNGITDASSKPHVFRTLQMPGSPAGFPAKQASCLLQELRAQDQALHLLGAALDLGGIIRQANILDHRTALQSFRSSLDLQVLDRRHRISVGKNIAITIPYFAHIPRP